MARWIRLPYNALCPDGPGCYDSGTVIDYAMVARCVCGEIIRFGRGEDLMQACECGRVYRVGSDLWVEEHFSTEGGA